MKPPPSHAGPSPSAHEAIWATAILLPALVNDGWPSALAWVGVVLVGAAWAGAEPLRWLGIAWCARAAVPSLPVLPVAAAGVRSTAGRLSPAGVGAALVGAALVLALPAEWRQPSWLMAVAACVLAGLRRAA